MKRLLFVTELIFLTTLWWQTRFDALQWWPSWSVLDNSIDYLIPFIYLSDILLGVMLVVWVGGEARVSSFKLRRFVVTRNSIYGLRLWRRPEFWWGLLLLAGVISIIANNVGFWGWYRWLKLVEGGLVAWWVFKRWGDERRRSWYAAVLLAGLSLEALLMMGEWFKQASMGWQWIGEWSFGLGTPGLAKVVVDGQKLVRPMGTFAHANIAAAVMVVALGLAGWGSRELRVTSYELRIWGGWKMKAQIWRRLQKAIGWVWVVLMIAAIGVSFSRAAWVIVGVYGVCLAIYAGRRYRRSTLNKPGVAPMIRSNLGARWGFLVVLGGLGVGLGPVIMARFGSLATTDSWSATLRLKLIRVAWQMWLQHPWGVGLNNFTLELARNMPVYNLSWWQPVHNVGLLVLAEMGWLGLLGLVGLVVVTTQWLVARLWLEQIKAPRGVWVLTGVWLVILGLSMIDHYWWTSQQAFLAVWGLGGGTWLYRKEVLNAKSPNTKPKS